MTEARYRLHLKVRDKPIMRDVMLDSEQPVVDILNWLEDENDFCVNLKKIYLIRDDGRKSSSIERRAASRRGGWRRCRA